MPRAMQARKANGKIAPAPRNSANGHRKTAGAAHNFPDVIASFNDYPTLHEALRTSRITRGISFETMDQVAGTSEAYYSKVLSPHGQRNLTMWGFCLALAGLGLRCLIVTDEDAFSRVQSRLQPRNELCVRWRNGTGK